MFHGKSSLTLPRLPVFRNQPRGVAVNDTLSIRQNLFDPGGMDLSSIRKKAERGPLGHGDLLIRTRMSSDVWTFFG